MPMSALERAGREHRYVISEYDRDLRPGLIVGVDQLCNARAALVACRPQCVRILWIVGVPTEAAIFTL
jgi:hypothetical protein